jgi:precorrin-6B methylase 2
MTTLDTSPGDIVVDIGANIGTVSLYAAKLCGAERVLSFEPFPDNYGRLCKNVEQNSDKGGSNDQGSKPLAGKI